MEQWRAGVVALVCMLAATAVCMPEMLIVILVEVGILPAAAIVIPAVRDGMAITPGGAAKTGVVVSDGVLVLQVWRPVRPRHVTTAPMLPPIPILLAAIRIPRRARRLSRNLSTRGE
jgi:hypothetical protein